MSTLAVKVTACRSERRSVERQAVDSMVQTRRGQHRMLARMTDISNAGCRLTTMTPLRQDEVIWIKLLMLDPQKARVTWSNGLITGCAFDPPLHLAIFDMVAHAMKGGR